MYHTAIQLVLVSTFIMKGSSNCELHKKEDDDVVDDDLDKLLEAISEEDW